MSVIWYSPDMSKQSAGILLYRYRNEVIQFFLVHPGGPFFVRKDLGSWTICKGEFQDGEDPYQAAIREFREETGYVLLGESIKLDPIKQKGGKIVYAWAMEGDVDPLLIKSNTFKLEWPPKSGRYQLFPEIDRGDWFRLAEAEKKINPAQVELLHQLIRILKLSEDQLL